MPLWTEAKYPGDAVRIRMLRRGDELGDVRIQQYSVTPQSVRVAKFLPGNEVFLPGDTPKTEPEQDEWCSSSWRADEVFDRFVQDAYNDGWENFDRNDGAA